MRKLSLFVALFVLAGLAWGVYWWIGATALEAGLGKWFDARRADGWVAETTTLEVHGFPNRFDTTFDGVKLSDPNTEVAWSAPVFQLLSLSYQPTHVIAIWPGEQTVSASGQDIKITAKPMRGSIAMDADAALPLDHTTIEIKDASFTSSKGWATGLEAGQLSMRRTPGAEDAGSFDIYLDLTNFKPDKGFLASLPGADGLPDTIEAVRMNGAVVFDKRWDRSAIEVGRPQPRHVVIETLSATWGDLDLQATGTLDVGPDGLPIGDIDVKATNWREMIEIAKASGKLKPEYVGAVTKGLELLARLSGDPETLDVPLGFHDGKMMIGPVSVAAAPTLRLP